MSSFGGDDDLTIHARVDNDASPELRDIRGELRDVGVQADRTGRQASRSSRGFHVMGKAAKVAAFGAKLAFGAALAGGYALTRLLQASFGEAREAQKVGRTTIAIIKATGGASKVTAGHVGRLATRLSNMAGIDDELIQTGANLLLTFKQIRNEAGKGNKIFDRATAAAVNLSAAGFGSIESGSKMLGKALNDPLKGITALGRAGVTFTQDQKDRIAVMVKNNDLLGAQRIILGEVEAQVGGVAKAQATWGDKAKVMFGNIEERIGLALLPLLDQLARWFVRTGGPVLDKYVGIFERKGVPALKRFGGHARDLGREYLPEVRDVLGEVFGVVKKMAPYVGDLLKGFNDLPGWAKSAILIGGGTAAVGSKLGAGKLLTGGKGILGAFTAAKPLPVYVVNNGIGKGLPGGGGKPGGGGVPVPTNPRGFKGVPGGLLGAAGLGAGLALANNDAAVHPGGTPKVYKKGSPQYDTMLQLGKERREYDSWWESMTKVNAGLDDQTKRVIAGAETATSKVDKARNSTEQLVNVLTGADRNWTPTLTINGLDSALAKTNAVRTNLLNLPALGSPGAGLGVVVAATPKHKRTKADGVAGAAPRVALPSGGVTIGQLVVHAEGAASDVDVQAAVTQALDDYFRDREERR